MQISTPSVGLLLDKVFFSRPAFFENAKRWQATPDQEILLPVRETHFIIRQDVCKNAPAKESDQKLNSIDWFASGQGFFGSAVFGGAIWLVIQSK